jgi:hypothetical protein
MDMRVREPVSHPMPEIAAFVAQMKSAFGEEEINEAIHRGKAGEPTFYAAETVIRLVQRVRSPQVHGKSPKPFGTATIAQAATADASTRRCLANSGSSEKQERANREKTWTCVPDRGVRADGFRGRHIFGGVESA